MTIGRIAVILVLALLMLKQNASANDKLVYKLSDLNYNSSEVLLITRSSQDPTNAALCSYSGEWFCINSTTAIPRCICGNNSHIVCSDNGPLLQFGYCATYSEDTGLVTVAKCPYLQLNDNMYHMTIIKQDYFIQLPKILAELNDSLCGPMNRKGIVCSECIDGFGPSVTSIGYKCVNCSDAWYGVSLCSLIICPYYSILLLYFDFSSQDDLTSHALFYYVCPDGRYRSNILYEFGQILH